MDKLTKSIIESGLPAIHQEVVLLQESLENFPTKISEAIDSEIQEKVNVIVAVAESVQAHTEELQQKCSEHIEHDLNKARTQFIVSASDTINELFNPQIDKLDKSISKYKSVVNSGSSLNPAMILILFFVIIGSALVGASVSKFMYSSELKQSQLISEALYSSHNEVTEKLLSGSSKEKFQSEFNETFMKKMNNG